ncbi:MAG: HAMP domain-containing protein [Kordiimonadaceae bacterium]|nr:HAMP domain-containing protein [Kordiimonadaceae bacterium]
MTALESETTSRLFSVRNLLLAVTFLLIVIAGSMGIQKIVTSIDQQDKAQRAEHLNELIDEFVQLKLAVAIERNYTITAYGLSGTVPEQFTRQIQGNRRAVEGAYDRVTELLESRDDFDRYSSDDARFKDINDWFDSLEAQFNKNYEAYYGLHEQIDEHLAGGNQTTAASSDGFGDAEEENVLDTRKIARTMNSLVDTAAKLRSVIETSYDYGDDRIANVNKLKFQLWVMIEYAAREAASLGENVASGAPISDVKKDQSSRYGGRGQNAWDLVQSIAGSSIASQEMSDQLGAIQETFFEDFAETKFELYDLSDTAVEDAEEDADVTVNYERSALDWVKASEDAAVPVNGMSSLANQLANDLNTEAVNSAKVDMVVASILIALILAGGAASLWVVFTRVVGPVNALSSTMMVLADGNLEVDIPHADRNNEIGDMARSVQVFKENAVERRAMAKKQAEEDEARMKRREEESTRQREETEERRKQDEEKAKQARADRRTAMLEMADQFEANVMAVVEGVSGSAREMEGAATGLATTAEDTSQKSNVVASAAQLASTNAQMVASAAEELSASVREITGQTTQSSAAARDAVGRTENASADISELVDAAAKIGEVVKLINDIAEQTNLLALNATIEAARAGDAGRGFAVVASEVKSLANQTARATQEISEQVDGMQQATNTAVRAMDQIKDIIVEIEATSISIASAVEEQDASTQEIARNVSEVSNGTEEVTSNIHLVNEGATSTGKAATEVLTAAQLLTQQSDELRRQVEGFLENVRA